MRSEHWYTILLTDDDVAYIRKRFGDNANIQSAVQSMVSEGLEVFAEESRISQNEQRSSNFLSRFERAVKDATL
jgi:hypothetical protein